MSRSGKTLFQDQAGDFVRLVPSAFLRMEEQGCVDFCSVTRASVWRVSIGLTCSLNVELQEMKEKAVEAKHQASGGRW